MSGEALVGCSTGNAWLAAKPSKRWGDLFFLLYTPFWFTPCLGIVVPYKLYEKFTELEYLLLGLVSAVPSFLLPFILVGETKVSAGKIATGSSFIYVSFMEDEQCVAMLVTVPLELWRIFLGPIVPVAES